MKKLSDKTIKLTKNSFQENISNSSKHISKRDFSPIKTFREIVIRKNKANKKVKDDISSMIPSIAQNKDKEGFISYSKENLNKFQSMCNELKRQITSEQNSFQVTNNFLFKHLNDDKGEVIDKRKPINDEYENKYRKLAHRAIPLYDSNSDNEDIGPVIIEPSYIGINSLPKIFNDCVIAFVTIAILIITPIEIGFIHNMAQRFFFLFLIINGIFDLCYIIDLVLGFFTEYNEGNDETIINYRKIIIHYIKGWFGIDLITAIPISTIINIFLLKNKNSLFYISSFTFYSNCTSVYLHVLKIIKVLKVIKLSLNNYLINSIIERMLQSALGKKLLIYVTLFIFILCIHVLSCIFIFLGYAKYPNWITSQHIEPANYIEVYIASIYFLCLTIFGIGYGDVLTTNLYERCYNLFLLSIGLLLYSWLVSALSKIKNSKSLQALDQNKIEEYNEKIELINNIKSTFPQIKQNLIGKLKRYILYKYEREQFNPKLIFDNLPFYLQRNLLFAMYKPVIQNFTFFKKFKREDFIMKVLMYFTPIVYYKNERLVNAGDFMEEMYFVKQGILTIELPLPSKLSNQIFRTRLMNKDFEKNKKEMMLDEEYIKLIDIRTNEHYGDIMMFLNERSPLSARVSSRLVELFLLKKIDMIDISVSFPSIWNEILANSSHNMKQINLLIEKTLLLCYENNKMVLEKFAEYYSLKSPKKEKEIKIQVNNNEGKKEEIISKATMRSQINSKSKFIESENTNTLASNDVFIEKNSQVDYNNTKKFLLELKSNCSEKYSSSNYNESTKNNNIKYSDSYYSSLVESSSSDRNKNIIIKDESFCTINDEIDEGELLNSPSKVNHGFEHFAKLKENINNIKINEDFFLY